MNQEKKKDKRKFLMGIVALLLAGAVAACVIAVVVNGQRGESAQETMKKTEKETEKETENGTDASGGETQTEAQETKEPEAPTSIVFTGDVLLSDYVLNNYNSKGISGVLDDTMQQVLQQADITMINHEFPFSTRGTQAPDKQYTFRVNPSYVSLITEMGTDIAGLANNHVLDYGKDALEDTFVTLENAGVAYTGAGRTYEDASRLIKVEKNGKTFGFLAASRVIPVGSWNVENSTPGVFCTYDTTHLVEKIRLAKQECDYVFVMVHWGKEHTDVLTDYQPLMAHKFIDAGADAVIGSHPHVLQGIEMYQDKPIFYSLGNFIFNRNIERTVAVKITITPEDQMEICLVPAAAEGAFTHSVTGDQAQSIYRYLDGLSETVTIDEAGLVKNKNCTQ